MTDDEAMWQEATEDLVAVLLKLRQDLDEWRTDERHDPPVPPVEFIYDTLRPQIAAALARLGVADVPGAAAG